MAWSLLIIRQSLDVGARPFLLITAFSIFFAISVPVARLGDELAIISLPLSVPVTMAVTLLLVRLYNIARWACRSMRFPIALSNRTL